MAEQGLSQSLSTFSEQIFLYLIVEIPPYKFKDAPYFLSLGRKVILELGTPTEISVWTNGT